MTTLVGARRSADRALERVLRYGTVLGTLVVVGVISASEPWLVALGVAAAVAVTVCFLHPPAAAYLLIATSPLLAGMDRGAVVPVLRLNEAIALLLGGTVLVRALLRGRRDGDSRRPLRRAEVSLLFLLATGSVLPLLWMLLRQRPISQLDVFYALVLWKCLGVYLVVRTTITSQRQIRRCLFIAMSAAAVAALVGVLQSLQLFGVPRLIAQYFGPEGSAGEDATYWGTSTVGHAQAMGDVMAFNLAIALAWLSRRMPLRPVVLGFAGLFVLGAVTTGEFSSVIAIFVAFCIAGIATRTLHRAVVGILPICVVAALAFQPVIQNRLNEFSSPEGIPPSWTGRINNLTTYVLPELTRDYNYTSGVRPAAQVTKSIDPYRFGYIESGHAWLLWTGGIPFLVGFFAYLVTNIRLTGRIARRRRDATGVAAVASLAALTVVAVMMTLDPHLTFRGSSELNFSLLALAHLGIEKGRVRLSDAHPTYDQLSQSSTREGYRPRAGRP